MGNERMYKCKNCGNDESFMGFFVKDIRATKKRWICVKCGKLYNRKEILKCGRCGELIDKKEKEKWHAVLDENGQLIAFHKGCIKNFKKYIEWIKKEGINCNNTKGVSK